MKHIYKWFIYATFLPALVACEKELIVYHTPDCWINFEYRDAYGHRISKNKEITDEIRTIKRSFIYAEPGTMTDTVWLKVTTLGFVSDQDRRVELQEISGEANTAVAGTHFIPVDDPALVEEFYYIPAGKVSAELPVVLKKDPSLENTDVQIALRLKANNYFKIGYEGLDTQFIVVSNQLSQPQFWGSYFSEYFGVYGRVKHRFLIDATGEKWDDTYIRMLSNDAGYMSYMAAKVRKKLQAENDSRQAAGLDVLKEADGTIVTI